MLTSWSPDWMFASVAAPLVSPNTQIAVYGVDTSGRGSHTIYFKNLKNGRLLRDALHHVTDNLVWANDSQTLFYVKEHPDTLRPYRVYRHTLGTNPQEDVLVYEERDEALSCSIFKSASRKYIFIDSRGTLSNEYKYLDAGNPVGSWRVFAPQQANHEYSVDHWKDRFYIRTNLDSVNFRMMTASADQTAVEHWKELIPNRNEGLLEDFNVLRAGLVTQERKDGLTRLRVIPWSGEAQQYVDFGQTDYSAYPASCGRFEEKSFCYVYTSLNTPSSLYRYNLATHAKTLMQRNEVLGGFDSTNYNIERVFATAKDGARIPISLVYRKGFRKNGTSPILLEAYGAYGDNTDPVFDPFLISLLDRGFVYGIAHVRGGEELGRKWYEDGRLLKKKNSFTDFIACAEYLVQQRYADPKRVFAEGASAGGLLIAAVTNMRSDLFRGVVAEVPWVDVLTTLLDDTIPGVATEYDEWGNPSDKQYYDYIRSYSPYDQIKRQRYPNMLVTSAWHDSQVPYWEPAKWVAKLRATKTDDNRLVLKTDMTAGHDGASGRDRQYRDVAFKYAFLLDLANITK